jgi:sterol desaturase/sphingolipid hydroxylase (fatty acid hydroxylase superfamily)
MRNPIIYVVPLFVALMVFEWAWTRRHAAHRGYSFVDTVANLSNGLLLLAVDIITRGFTFGLYVYVYQHARLFDFARNSVATWVIFFLGTDLCYYAFHRTAHTSRLFWLLHAPHHQSEHYNLSVALRQGAFQYAVDSFFYLPLAVAGCPPEVFALQLTLLKAYQFWLHTEVVRRVPWLEGILSTPSSHRVHHGTNPVYIDKNMGGTLAIWDRLFGTFQAELAEEPVRYGVQPTFTASNGYSSNAAEVRHLRRALKGAEGLRAKLRAVLGPVTSAPLAPASCMPSRLVGSKVVRVYVVFNFVVCSFALGLSAAGAVHSLKLRAALVLFAAAGLITGAGWLDDPKQFARLDALRWASVSFFPLLL